MRRVNVILPTATPHGFDYTVPGNMAIAMGDIVEVTLAKKSVLGVVWSEGSGDKIDPKKLKPIVRKFETIAPFSDKMRRFIDWVTDYTLAPRGAVLKMALACPKALTHPPKKTMAPQQFCLQLARLNEAQKNAADSIIALPSNTHKTFVIDGVTGSGKTETYAAVIAAHLNADASSQILVMLPEIALTHQMVERLTTLFGSPPILWHSGVSEAERKRAYLAIASGNARLILGARSALFLPYKNLSMIVVDEEHEQSYKQEDGVLYHARDMAVVRGAIEQIPVVLVSATPSLETMNNCASGKYQHLMLAARFGGAKMPHMIAIDMRAETLDSTTFISPTLRQALLATCAKGQQSLLFLNRRGYAPLMLCRCCGYRFTCSECSAWLVLHKKKVASHQSPVISRQLSVVSMQKNEDSTSESALSASHLASSKRAEETTINKDSTSESALSALIAEVSRPKQEVNAKDYLSCHHCGHRESLPKQCPSCKSEDCLVSCGPGVERIAEELSQFMPQARFSLLSSDSAVSSAEIAAITSGERDIIIGTQMVAKGYHFPNLTLIGIVDADMGLQGADLRASERSFQLLHQVAGRAGREALPGTVYVQTYLPEHPVMGALLACDRDTFMALEQEGRAHGNWPPFGQLASLLFDGPREAEVRSAAQMAARLAPRDSRIRVLGPAPASMARVRGQYRYRLLVKTPRNVNLQALLREWCAQLTHPRSVRLKVDMNPYNFM